MEFSHTLSTSTILSNGLSFPLIGLGTFKSEDIEKSLKTAIELGYRSIDTAKLYQNEKQIGKILQELFKSGKVTRSDLFITTKTYNNPALSVYDQLKESLIDLQVDYVDLCLDHWPHGFFDLQSKENKAKPRFFKIIL